MKEVLKRVERSGLTITVLENWLGFKHTHTHTDKDHSMGKEWDIFFQQMMLGQIDIHMQKNKFGLLSQTINAYIHSIYLHTEKFTQNGSKT